jgi:hypothetical protein
MPVSQFRISKVSRKRHPIPTHERFPIGRNFKFFYNAKIRGLGFIKSVGAKRLPNTPLFQHLCGIGNDQPTPLPVFCLRESSRRQNMLSNDYPSCCKTTQPFSEILQVFTMKTS